MSFTGSIVVLQTDPYSASGVPEPNQSCGAVVKVSLHEIKLRISEARLKDEGECCLSDIWRFVLLMDTLLAGRLHYGDNPMFIDSEMVLTPYRML